MKVRGTNFYVLALVLGLSTYGCQGVLIIPERGEPDIKCTTSAECGFGLVCNNDGVCTESPGVCSEAYPKGDCAPGYICDAGICYCVDPEVCPCPTEGCEDPKPCCEDCQEDEGCEDCECVPYLNCEQDPSQEACINCELDPSQDGCPCSTDNPDGPCPPEEVCVGGDCKPLAPNECIEDENLNCKGAWCKSGLVCDNCRCRLIEEICSMEFPEGDCPNAQKCVCDDEECKCINVGCSTDYPNGWCPDDQVCKEICSDNQICTVECELIACSILHTKGACENEDEYCSETGSCISKGTCKTVKDCDVETEYCSIEILPDVDSKCLKFSECQVNDDCEVIQADKFGQGYECKTETVLQCADCEPGQCIDCKEEQCVDCEVEEQCVDCDKDKCAERKTCVANRDCKPDKYCSSQGNCYAKPTCDGHSDCASNEICSVIGICIEDTMCEDHGDCDIATEFCANDKTCLKLGDCKITNDCPPGNTCESGMCEPSSQVCTSNDFKEDGCPVDQFYCCSTDNEADCCDIDKEKCGAEGHCIPKNECVDDSDCLQKGNNAYFVCDHYVCLPGAGNTCDQCDGATEKCSILESACIPIENCASDQDCLPGEQCNAKWECELAPACGFDELSTGNLVAPNMLIVLDRSRSMHKCTKDSNNQDVHYWKVAVDAIKDVVAAEKDRINFGLSIFPRPSPLNNCESDNDCLHDNNNTYYTCNLSTNLCEPVTICNDDSECAATEICSAAGGCIPFSPSPPITCVDDSDCLTSYYTCDTATTHACIPSESCELFYPLENFKKPCGLFTSDICNVYGACIAPEEQRCVVDADCPSGFMCNFDWYCVTCDNAYCDYRACNDNSPNKAGVIEVAVNVSAFTQPLIENRLNKVIPGGATPTAGTLRSVFSDLTAFGLTADDRQNTILLITDGEATGDSYNTTIKTCMPPCADTEQNGQETDIDCGGMCEPCQVGFGCLSPDDCESKLCREGLCRPTTCADLILNGDETDLNCGGSCGPCADGNTCSINTDCKSKNCQNNICQNNACDDSIQNGEETDIDCGGSICDTQPCKEIGVSKCEIDTDCESNSCQENICRPTHCSDSSISGDETDLNCGGSCAPCDWGQTCSVNTDCPLIGECNNTLCEITDSCANGIQDNDETAIDCGGSCNSCAGAKLCDIDSDCLSQQCRVCFLDYPYTTDEQKAHNFCTTKSAIDRLYALPELPIKTFLVGFAFATPSDYLNCYAAHARTVREDECADINTSNCDTAASNNKTCYYTANDTVTLRVAFDDIISRVQSCAYTLAETPSDPSKMWVYMDYLDGRRERLDRYTFWNYNPRLNQLELMGQACDDLKAGLGVPLVIKGCKVGEG